ncbi:MAG: P1 family peptidase [Acidobacteriaceae bacterium]|nr:P1 family peptidase [Acidobacteriaceae bacterium]
MPSLPRRAFLSGAALASALAPLGAQTGEDADRRHGAITDVGGLRVGHFTDSRRPTGCTVVLFDRGAAAGVDVRGAAPGTRETDLLNPINTVQSVNAILLTGGSSYGLDAAAGVMQYCEEHRMGFPVGVGVVPIVPAAVIFDLEVGDEKIRPDARAGYAACEAATNAPPAEGNIGVGAGATVGKLFGNKFAMKSGFGTASIRIGDTGLIVGAVAGVNSVGDVRDHRTGKILAGARSEDGQGFADAIRQIMQGATPGTRLGAHTTVGIIATNAFLTKDECTKVAQMSHDGFARTINPTHTAYDGDTIFATATGEIRVKTSTTVIGSVAAEAMARAINRAVLTAAGIPGFPAHRDMPAAAG